MFINCEVETDVGCNAENSGYETAVKGWYTAFCFIYSDDGGEHAR
jgi:hypothetical protein